ncbi:threonine-phosphate decarboxylase CobD [Crocosphaera sp. XPORK-15E]|uniref:threonine-phosphate decarboxylase CobD n=1 Tax=Crocosphaera sp. XPORK-15E TaxID=3110247 RepID=UPI002B20072A|nr:threonine-phosphate decarboxylase CobD [Crocosphaera sp. XPORK-15E]MEA5536261.1 threonine-phosphate decarboxylase CobD [Crocosphaera sp. XPORK-15E]
MKRPLHGGNLVWAAKQIGCPASSIMDFSASINPLGPPQSALTAIQEALNSLNHYPDPNYQELRQALAQWHNLSAEWVLPGNGAAELLTWAGRQLAELNITYLITPAFQDYWRTLQGFGAKIETHGFNWQDLDPVFTLKNLPRKPAGIIINNPHNPTGKLWKKETLLPLLEQFKLVVVDEAFMDFVPPEQQQSLIPWVSQYPNLVIVRSLTKFYSLPGLRLGYAIAHPDRLQQWQTWRDPWCVNSLAAAAGIAVIQDREFEQQTREWLLSAQPTLFQGLLEISDLNPLVSQANFLLVETGLPSSQLQQKLLHKHRILIRDCLSFPELGDRYFRVAVRTQAENQQLIDALKEI